MTTMQAAPGQMNGEWDAAQGASELDRLLSSPMGAIEQQTRAEIEIQSEHAHRRQRNPMACQKEAIALATSTPEMAESCYYALPRGGRTVTGPSVRCAEIMAYAWGNIRVSTRIVEVGEGYVITQGVCHDVQKNMTACIDQRTTIHKKRNKPKPDEDDIALAVARSLAIAKRNAIFSVIPMSVANAVLSAAMHVAAGGAVPIETKRAKAIEHGMKYGVDEQRILAALEIATRDQMDEEQLATLRGFYSAIRDGEAKIEECFPPLESKDDGSKAERLAKRLQGDKKPAAEQPKQEPEPEPEPEPVDPASAPWIAQAEAAMENQKLNTPAKPGYYLLRLRDMAESDNADGWAEEVAQMAETAGIDINTEISVKDARTLMGNWKATHGGEDAE